MEASKITITPQTKAYYDKPLSYKKRRQMREQAVIAYIESKPAGSRIKVKEFQRVLNTKNYQGAHKFISELVKTGIVGRHSIGINAYSYYVNNAKVTKPAEPKSEPQSHSPRPSVNIEQLAVDFAWRYNSDSLREFMKWLGPKI